MPNVYLNQRPCNITDPFLFWCAWVRWTCWNTLFMLFLVHAYGSRVWRPPAAPLCTCQCSSKQDPTDVDHLWYLDGPWRLFWPVLVPWCCVEAVLTFSWTYAPMTSVADCGTNKLAPKWIAPFKVLERIGAVAYKLKLAVTMRIHDVFHVSLLKPYHRDGRVEPPPPPELVDDEPEWEVNCMMEHRFVEAARIRLSIS